MSDGGLLDAAFRLAVGAAALGATACLLSAARGRRDTAAGRRGAAQTRELTWSLVPATLLAALLMLLGRG